QPGDISQNRGAVSDRRHRSFGGAGRYFVNRKVHGLWVLRQSAVGAPTGDRSALSSVRSVREGCEPIGDGSASSSPLRAFRSRNQNLPNCATCTPGPFLLGRCAHIGLWKSSGSFQSFFRTSSTSPNGTTNC